MPVSQAQAGLPRRKRRLTSIAATEGVSLRTRGKKLTAFVELESATRLLE